MSKTYCKGILVNDETRAYTGCAGGEDCPVCKGKPFHHDDKCRYWDEGKFCDCGVWDLRYQQIAYESVIDRLTAELAETNYRLDRFVESEKSLAEECIEAKQKAESAERELATAMIVRNLEIDSLQSRLSRYESALKMIAGDKQCLNSLMSNTDIAREALKEGV